MQRPRSYCLIIGIGFLVLLLGVLHAVTPKETGTGDPAGNEVVFWGEGHNWSAQIREEWSRAIVSEAGETNRTRVRRVIQYKGSDIDRIGEVDYYLDGDKGSSSGTHMPDDQGRIILPVIEGDFAAAEKTDIWTLVLKWEGGEEIIELKAR